MKAIYIKQKEIQNGKGGEQDLNPVMNQYYLHKNQLAKRVL